MCDPSRASPIMSFDAISDGSTPRATSLLRRATTGPQPTALCTGLEAAPQVRRTPSASGVRPRPRQDARHKNAEDVRALLGESAMRRILPSTGSGPPSPVLLRRSATAAATPATRNPTWFLQSPSRKQKKPHRVLSNILDEDEEDEEEDDDDHDQINRHDDSDPSRPLLPLRRGDEDDDEDGTIETSTFEPVESPALRAVTSSMRLAGVPTVLDRQKIPIIAFLLGCVIPVLRLLCDRRYDSLLFEWFAFATAWRLLFLSARTSPRECAFLYHQESDVHDRITTEAHRKQVDLVRRRLRPETFLFFLPFVLVRVLVTAWEVSRVVRTFEKSKRFQGQHLFAEVSLTLLTAVSQTYTVLVFLTACAFFRVACGVAMGHLNQFLSRFEKWGVDTACDVSVDVSSGDDDVSIISRNDTSTNLAGVRGAGVMHTENEQLRYFLKNVSRRFRFFLAITAVLVFFETFTVALRMVRTDKQRILRFFSLSSLRSSPMDSVSFLCRVLCVVLNVRAAAIVTHRLQKVTGFASKRHADVTLEESMGIHSMGNESEDTEDTTRRNFNSRSAVLGSFRDQPLRISVYGFTWDRDFFRGLHMIGFTTGLFIVTRALVVRGG